MNIGDRVTKHSYNQFAKRHNRGILVATFIYKMVQWAVVDFEGRGLEVCTVHSLELIPCTSVPTAAQTT